MRLFNTDKEGQIKLFSFFLMSIFLIAFTSATAYNIADWDDLDDMRDDLAGDYTLLNDLNSSTAGFSTYQTGAGFDPIGDLTVKFTGNLDGNNHTIDSLYINRPTESHVGLFGVAQDSTIENIGIININISSSGGHRISGLVGYSENMTIDECFVSGNVLGIDQVGGLLGETIGSSINNSYSTATVTGGQAVAGLIGYLTTSDLDNSYATGNIIGTDTVGGLVGRHYYSNLDNSYSTGSVTSDGQTGGLVGQDCGNPNSITNSYWLNNSDDATDCYDGGNTGCTAKTDISYFYNYSNAPMSSWSFTTIWDDVLEFISHAVFKFYDLMLSFTELASENITFTGNENHSRRLVIPVSSNVFSATLDLEIRDTLSSNISIPELSLQRGIANDGDFMWLSSQEGMDGILAKYYKNGTSTGENFSLLELHSPSEYWFVGGVTTYDDFIWATEEVFKNRIYKYYKNGTYTGNSFALPKGRPMGLDNDGTYMWIFTDDHPAVYKYHINGTYTGEYFNTTSSGNLHGRGIAIQGDYLWVSDESSNLAYKYYKNGTYTNTTFDLGARGNTEIRGIFVEDNIMWSTDYTDKVIFKHPSLNLLTNPYLEIGTPDGTYEWNYTGEFNTSETTSDLSSAINTALDDGACTGGILSGTDCLIPFLFHSDTAGILEISNISILSDTTEPIITIFAPISVLNYSVDNETTDLNFTVTDTNLEDCWYDYNGTNITIPSCENTTLDLETGNTNVTIYANDSGGNIASETTSWIYRTLTENITIMNSSENCDENTLNYTGLMDGIYTLSATACNIYGYCNTTADRTFYIDTLFPLIDYTLNYLITTILGGVTTEDIVFEGNENHTLNLTLPKDSEVSSASLDLEGLSSPTECYQESANESNQSGTDDDCNLDYSGNYYIHSSGDDGYFDINYTSPTEATSVKWFVEYRDPATKNLISENLTIPSACFNSTIQLRLHSRAGLSNIKFYCYNQTDWHLIQQKNIAFTVVVYGVETSASLYDGNYTTCSAYADNTTTTVWRDAYTLAGCANIRGAFYDEGVYWNITNYPTNSSLEIGTPDGNYEWNYTGEFNTSETTSDLSSAINTALDDGNCTGGTIDGDNCIIPLLFHSDTEGILKYSAVNISSKTYEGTPNNVLANFTEQDWIYVNVTYTELNEKNVTFVLWDPSGIINTTTYSDMVVIGTQDNTTYSINWTDLPESMYFWNVTMCDLAGNCNTTETLNYGVIDTTITFDSATENLEVELRSEITINATNSLGNVCLDIQHPLFGVNYTCGYWNVGMIFYVEWFRNLLFSSGLDEETLDYTYTNESNFSLGMHIYDEVVNLSVSLYGSSDNNGTFPEDIYIYKLGTSIIDRIFMGTLMGDVLWNTVNYLDAEFVNITFSGLGPQETYFDMDDNAHNITLKFNVTGDEYGVDYTNSLANDGDVDTGLSNARFGGGWIVPNGNTPLNFSADNFSQTSNWTSYFAYTEDNDGGYDYTSANSKSDGTMTLRVNNFNENALSDEYTWATIYNWITVNADELNVWTPEGIVFEFEIYNYAEIDNEYGDVCSADLDVYFGDTKIYDLPVGDCKDRDDLGYNDCDWSQVSIEPYTITITKLNTTDRYNAKITGVMETDEEWIHRDDSDCGHRHDLYNYTNGTRYRWFVGYDPGGDDMCEDLDEHEVYYALTNDFNFTVSSSPTHNLKFQQYLHGSYDDEDYEGCNSIPSSWLKVNYLNQTLLNRTNSSFITSTLHESAGPITAATVDYHYNLSNNETLTDYVTATGVSWESIAKGVEHTFTTQGQDLRVKFDFTTLGGYDKNVGYISYFNLSTPKDFPSNLQFDFGKDGVIDANISGDLNSSNSPYEITITNPNLTSAFSGTADLGGHSYQVPLEITTDTFGQVNLDSFNLTYEFNPVYLDNSAIQTYLNNAVGGFINLTFTVGRYLSTVGGFLSVVLNGLDYAGGNETYTILAHDANYTVNSSLNVTYYYSRWDYQWVPEDVEWLFFSPSNPLSQSVVPYGQTVNVPILNITNYGYGSPNATLSLYVNGSLSCVSLTVATDNNKSNGFLINESWTNLTVLDYLETTDIYMWADYSCSYNNWTIFEPQFYFRQCANTVNGQVICSEELI